MKATKKQLKAQITNELSKLYKQRSSYWEKDYKRLSEKYNELKIKYNEALDRALKAESKLEEQEAWIQRLQDFCNLTNEDRQQAIEKMRLDFKRSKNMENFDKMTSFLFGRIL